MNHPRGKTNLEEWTVAGNVASSAEGGECREVAPYVAPWFLMGLYKIWKRYTVRISLMGEKSEFGDVGLAMWDQDSQSGFQERKQQSFASMQ